MNDLAYIQIDEDAYNALVAQFEQGTWPEGHKRMYYQWQRNAWVTGFWKKQANFIVLNIVAPAENYDGLTEYLDPSAIGGHWDWSWDGKVDGDTEYAGQHDDLLALQEDHVTYDIDGNEVSREPASFENSNWRHGFSGQKKNRFARSVSRGFSNGVG